MDKHAAISVKNLEKSFVLPKERHTTAKQVALNIFKKKEFLEQRVLRGLSFEIDKGDFFGIIGRNGSGKSTLLKILAGIYEPDSGEVKVNGKISPFLELGVGFNPELTGFENIYLNGAILGLTKKEIDNKIRDIVEFAELQEFLDQKLKNYSSGMQVRLAFSVAIHAHAPIILLDEVLAVGDMNFQQKCFKVFERLKREGKTIVFVTHDMVAAKNFCNKGILIDQGKIAVYGPIEKVANRYEELNLREINTKNKDFKDEKNQWGDNEVVIKSVLITTKKGSKSEVLKRGEDFNLTVSCQNLTKNTKKINYAMAIFRSGLLCFDVNTFNSAPREIYPSEAKKFSLSIKNPNLLPGQYTVNVSIYGETREITHHAVITSLTFIVQGDSDEMGVCGLNYEWKD